MNMSTLTVTFIRHGESEDNLKNIWAGWKDAPLSELGRRQAAALGAAFSSTPISRIFSSPSLRARSTGEAVLDGQAESKKPPFELNLNLREQHWGIAEGHPWILVIPEGKTKEQCFAESLWPASIFHDRNEKFPEGESCEDLARRAEQALRECVLPYLSSGEHIVLTSHGLCISELVAALLRLDPESRRDISYAGLRNTAWTRAEVTVRDAINGSIDVTNPPPLLVKVTHVDEHSHVDGLVPTQNINDSQKAAFLAGKKDSIEGTPSV